MEVLRCEGLTKRYGTLTAVDHLDLVVFEGEVFGLLGPNGAGKTTTLEMLEGLRRPDEGRIVHGAVDLLRHPREARENFGVQLQATAFFELLTVTETLQLFASFYRRSLPVDRLLRRFELVDKARAYVRDLSGGQRQRLAVAVALVNDPRLVFLDEPTAGLDPQARRNLWGLIRELKEEGRTVVLTTHYMDEAEELCDRLAIMDHGRILDVGRPAEVIARHLPGAIVEWEGTDSLEGAPLPGATRVQVQDGRTTVATDRLEDTLVALALWAKEQGRPLSGLTTRRASLEDVFLHLTGRSLRE